MYTWTLGHLTTKNFPFNWTYLDGHLIGAPWEKFPNFGFKVGIQAGFHSKETHPGKFPTHFITQVQHKGGKQGRQIFFLQSLSFPKFPQFQTGLKSPNFKLNITTQQVFFFFHWQTTFLFSQIFFSPLPPHFFTHIFGTQISKASKAISLFFPLVFWQCKVSNNSQKLQYIPSLFSLKGFPFI